MDSLDCFNEDLVWILDKLVARSGGAFGIISRHIRGDMTAELLARTTAGPWTTADPAEVPQALASLAVLAGSAEGTHRNDELPDMRQAAWSPQIWEQTSDGYRILQLVLAPTENVTLVASVARPGAVKPFAEADVLVAARLYPVLSRYVRLWWLHRMERRRAKALSAALDLSDVGVILLDRRSFLFFANSRANALLARRDGLQCQNELIGATEPKDNFRLQAAVQVALQSNLADSASDDEHETPILTLQRAGQHRALIATVMKVQHTAVDPRDPAVIIYVFDPEQDIEQTLAPVCRAYRLSATETRLVHQLVTGLRITEAAQVMKIQPATVRAHLKQIFRKTMTNRQADLIRLMYASMTRTNAGIKLSHL